MKLLQKNEMRMEQSQIESFITYQGVRPNQHTYYNVLIQRQIKRDF